MTEITKNGLEFILTSGEEKQEEGKTFTQLRGGFEGNQSVMISDLQIAELLGYATGVRHVRRILERNKQDFVVGEHFYDISKNSIGVSNWHTYEKLLLTLGYTKQSLTQAKNIYIFSKAGFLLLLKFAEGDKATSIYKKFIESYFELEEKLEVATEALEETTEALQANAISITKEMAMLQVELAYETDEKIRLSLLERVQELAQLSIQSNRALEKKKAAEEFLSHYKPQLTFANTIEQNTANNFDIGDFAKVVNIDGMGRNKLMEWLRDQKILMDGGNKNMPYQQHTGNHFKVVYVNTKNNSTVPKTLLTGNGVIYVVKRLIKSGKLSSDVTGKEVLSLLENQVCNSDSKGEQNGE